MTTKSKAFAYLRVSTWTQDINKDRQLVKEYVTAKYLPMPIFYEDHMSGGKTWKERKIKDILDESKKGDIVIITEFSRVSRDMGGVMEVLRAFLDKQVLVHSIKESIVFDGSLQSDITAKIFAMLADIERTITTARINDAIESRRQKNIDAGRAPNVGKSKLDRHKDDIVKMLINGANKSEVANKCDTSVNNLNTYLHKRGIDLEIEKAIHKRREESSKHQL